MTESEIEYMELLWKRRTPVKVIAEKLGYSVAGITSMAYRHRDRFPYRHRPVDKERASRYVDLIIAGEMTVDEAARKLDINRHTVVMRVNRKKKENEQARMAEGAGEG